MSEELSPADIAAIKARFEAVEQHIGDADFAAWAEDFTEDAVFMPPNAPSVSGRSALQEYGKAFPEVRAFSLLDVKVEEARGDLAVASSRYSISTVIDGNVLDDSGKQLVVLRKQPNGSWLTSHAIYNSDVPAT